MKVPLFQRLLLWAVLTLVVLSPLVMGVFPIFPAALVFAALLLLCLWAFSGSAPLRAQNVALVVLSACFTLTSVDLLLRTLLSPVWDDRPRVVHARAWPPMPLVNRYVKNATYEGIVYGDLAAMTRDKTLRHKRSFRMVTDAFGFRNDPRASRRSSEFDLLLLGDSFGAGGGTHQDSTWGSVLARDYGLRVYNLSISVQGLWQEFITLSLEIERLKPREGTVVLWAIFTGNDLEDPYHAPLEVSHLPWQGPVQRIVFALRTFSHRSPLGRLMRGLGDGRKGVIVKEFIDGRKLLFFVPYTWRRDRPREEILRHPNYGSVQATINAMKNFASEERLEVAVVLIPTKEEVYSWVLDGAAPWSTRSEPSGFSLVLSEICRQHGFPFLDLKPYFVEASRKAFAESGDLLWWDDDTHWNTLGHRLAASAVYERLMHPMKGNEESP